MANHKSAEKRHRQSLKRRDRNRTAKAAVRTALKKAQVAIEAKDPNAQTLVRSAESLAARAASKGILKKKTVARVISRAASRVAAQTAK